jgi:hypothetical protein
MRLAFLALLLANALLFLRGQGYLGTPDAGREPERLSRQLTPEKLRIVPPEALRPVAEQLAE